MVKIRKEDIAPVCPHCEQEVEELIEVDRGWFVINNVLCCPHCRKIVGVNGGWLIDLRVACQTGESPWAPWKESGSKLPQSREIAILYYRAMWTAQACLRSTPASLLATRAPKLPGGS
jgi:hypothetical protein